jgi:hypothetical protein
MIAAGHAVAMWFEKGKISGDAQLSLSIRPSPCVTPGSAFVLPVVLAGTAGSVLFMEFVKLIFGCF